MNLLIIGINHKSAPVELREKVAFTHEQLPNALKDISRVADFSEVAVLSTCNRTEIIAITDHANEKKVVDWLAAYHEMQVPALEPSIYTKRNQEAVYHAARVACGLDSMIIGEPQIFGQVKDAYEQADLIGTLGSELHHLSQNTFRIAKRVRSETAIGQSSVSIASTAVTLAEMLFSDLTNRNVLLVGAGETSKLVGRHLKSAGFCKLTIANRTLSNARKLAEELGGSAIDLQTIPSILPDADVVISSTASQLAVMGKGMVERTLKSRRHRPVMMIDLAVPRDIEPEVGELRDIYLYSVDDLQEIINANLNNRHHAAEEADLIIKREIASYRFRHESREKDETLVRFREHHEAIKTDELAKALIRLKKGGPADDVLAQFANQLTNKLLHRPTQQLKAGNNDIIKVISDLYQLDKRSE